MYPANLNILADKQQLISQYKGVSVDSLPTPSFLINPSVFKINADKMLENANHLQCDFRAHVKTHKTLEGTRLQLGTGKLKTDRIVVSTLAEAWGLMPLVEEGLIKDMLFSLPVVKSRLGELADLATKVPVLTLMLDSADQLDVLAEYNQKHPKTNKWLVFIKINMGTNRAGLLNDSDLLTDTLDKILKNPHIKSAVGVYGFYCHAGHSYASKSPEQAKEFLIEEIKHADLAAKQALSIDPSLDLVISVGSTPTANSSNGLSVKELESALGKLSSKLELHAGNYIFCDEQQVATGCVTHKDVSIQVLAEVVSTYPGRGVSPGEQLINAGVIALAREFGPVPGHGRIVEPKGYENWIVGRLSQEHGILTVLDQKETKFIPLGTKVGVCPQHSCITAAAYPWYFIVEGGEVVDIWVPFRGW